MKIRKYFFMFSILTMISMSTNAFANFLVVTSDQISVTPEGLFVNIDGLPVEVESLNSANDGFVVAIPSPKAAICPICGSDKYVPGRFCPVCGFPDDAKKNMKKNA